MAKAPSGPGQPFTGNGFKGGARPRTEDLRMVNRYGEPTSSQPLGWVGKVIKFVRRP